VAYCKAILIRHFWGEIKLKNQSGKSLTQPIFEPGTCQVQFKKQHQFDSQLGKLILIKSAHLIFLFYFIFNKVP
jgi:hypothetical protein